MGLIHYFRSLNWFVLCLLSSVYFSFACVYFSDKCKPLV